MKECVKITQCNKKWILNLAYKEGLLLQSAKIMISLKKCMRKMVQVKLVKVLEKYPKLKVVMNLNGFNHVGIC